MTSPRPLDSSERALLGGLLAVDVDGAAALREQASSVRAAPGCTCGCGSLDLFVQDSSPRSTAPSPFPGQGAVLDDAGDEVGGLIVFLDAGRLSYLEIYSYADPLALPPPERVRWTVTERRPLRLGRGGAAGDSPAS